ncbi:hypothetical protein B0H14DRAFT_2308710, partial [Mycena olivaceomarginata]
QISTAEWDTLEKVPKWLKLSRSTIMQISATKKPMLSATHAIFHGLQQSLKEIITSLPDETDATLKAGLVAAHCKLSDYFRKFDQSKYYL